MSNNQLSNKRTAEDYKKVMEEQVKALKILNKRLRTKEDEIEKLNKEIGRLKWLLITKKGMITNE